MYDIADLELPHSERDEQLTELRATPGVPYDDRNDLWLVARHADVCTASSDPTTFSNAGGVTYFDAVPLSFVTMDPPEHGRLRRIVSRQFTPRMVKELREQTRLWTEAALDTVEGKAEFDFVESIAAPVTLRVIAEMVGMPAHDLPQIKTWTDQMMDASGRLEEPGMLEQATGAYVAWAAYVDAQIELRLESPGVDLLSRLAHADDERLDREELALFTTALMVAGNETTRHTSSRGIEVLGAHPEQRARFSQDPSCRPAAVEEILRWATPVRAFMRTIASDTVLSGTELSVGDRLVLLYPSANRDEAVFDEPFAFDIGRDPNPHLAFGIGTHYCIGANLGRMELDVILGAVLERHPELGLVPGTEPVHRASGLVAGVASMPVQTG
ncbi:MAG: cytochrome P450 [Actinomycetia bacterium]|nr:cytochrome P450 [Actinomycetes bacterium]